MKLNFQVGDVVKFHTNIVNREAEFSVEPEVRATVIRVGHRLNGEKWMNYEVDFGDGETYFARSKWMYLCEECTSREESVRDEKAYAPRARNIVGYPTEEEEHMSVLGTAVDKVRQLAMSADDRLLKKFYIVDECGNVTADGKALLLELLFTENKDSVVAKLKEIEAEEDKKNKKSK